MRLTVVAGIQRQMTMNNNRLIRILLILGLIVGVSVAIVYRDHFDAAAL